MKKILVLILTLALMAMMPVSALAAGSTDLNVSYSLNESGNIVVYASIVNINDSVGLAGIQYEVVYDSAVLELVNANVKTPDLWVPYLGSGDDAMVENLSTSLSNGLYRWCLVSALEDNGITEDDQFTIELEFKAMAETETKVAFNSIMSCNTNIEEVSSASKNVQISTSGIKITDVSENTSSESDSESQSSDNSVENPDDTSGSSSDSKADADDASSSNGSDIVGDTNTDNNDNSNNDDDDNNSIIVISVIVAAIIVGLAVVLFIKFRKGKK